MATEAPQRSDFMEDWMKDYFEPLVSLNPKRLGFGQKPALLLIDFQKSSKQNKLMRRAIKNAMILLRKVRERGIPVYYTVIAYRKDFKDFIPNKIQPQRVLGTSDQDVVDELKPRDEEVVLVKKGNSAFMGTELLAMLIRERIDTLIISGMHTSGCIRATSSDSFGLGFKTILPEECIGEGKGLAPHKANLCDIHIRGADVITLREVLDYLDNLH